MTANEQAAQAPELERQATQAEDPAVAVQRWQEAQQARFGNGGGE